jgi:hypothetical protein
MCPPVITTNDYISNKKLLQTNDYSSNKRLLQKEKLLQKVPQPSVPLVSAGNYLSNQNITVVIKKILALIDSHSQFYCTWV